MTAIVRLGDILHGAISRNDVAKAIELMEHGAPVNERRDHGTTPLHWAASEDYVDIVEALLAHGARASPRAACRPPPFRHPTHTTTETVKILQSTLSLLPRGVHATGQQ